MLQVGLRDGDGSDYIERKHLVENIFVRFTEQLVDNLITGVVHVTPTYMLYEVAETLLQVRAILVKIFFFS